MSTKKVLFFSLLAVALLAAGGMLLDVRTAQAHAEAAPSTETSYCLGCHESLYYNYDLGKHYCLTEASAGCVDCHNGNPTSALKDAAHAGLVRYPIVNGDISRCESCHETDAQAHVDTFAAIAGYHPTVLVAAQTPPAAAAGTEVQPRQAAMDAQTLTGLTVILFFVVSLFVFCFLMNRSCNA